MRYIIIRVLRTYVDKRAIIYIYPFTIIALYIEKYIVTCGSARERIQKYFIGKIKRVESVPGPNESTRRPVSASRRRCALVSQLVNDVRDIQKQSYFVSRYQRGYGVL